VGKRNKEAEVTVLEADTVGVPVSAGKAPTANSAPTSQRECSLPDKALSSQICYTSSYGLQNTTTGSQLERY
jgi:hypothetical protein